jgi:hypothetical protein
MGTLRTLDQMGPYVDSMHFEKRLLGEILVQEGLDPLLPLVANGVSVSNIGSRRTYLLGKRVLLRVHYDQHLITAVEVPGEPLHRLAWAG